MARSSINTTVPQIMAEIMAQLPEEEIREQVRETAKEAAEYARTIAPVYHGESRPSAVAGEYRDSIHDEDAPDHDGMPAAMVISRSRIAHFVEYGIAGTGKFPADEAAVFAKTAIKFGGTGPDIVDETGPGDAGTIRV
jgi:hypothetical protein